ncbi:copper-binding protein [Hyunsoonleella flava]|uniref:Copper-binding protein n=1 Tax=Hyunsoonleella flava TaxID=2527939 RepID=A0A4Q9FD14_9FLAO|nr:nitrous oxide reductase accessory protein NosL [Hyunsoonleella flava]TBN02405.1 copper-binding protein [Hyunsoonleella flava]
MKRFALLLLMYTCIGCSKTAEPINYGTDMCHYCKMTIVTKTHAAQIVTGKGKQYKFDAIECMIRFLEPKKDLIPESQVLIVNYNTPGIMIDAKTASYVISEEILSPMGANLTGFKSTETAKQTINSTSAKYYDWNGIFNKLN